jgi:signal transduction histidine kinase
MPPPIETSEGLREKLLALQSENHRLRGENEQANLLVQSLESLLRTEPGGDPFASVFQSLHHLFDFEQALLLCESSSTDLECVVAEPVALVGMTVRTTPFLQKVLNGRVSTTFDDSALALWQGVEHSELVASRSVLYLPVQIREERGVLALLASRDGPGFDRRDVTLARKFSLLAAHALATRHASERIRLTEARALAAEETDRMKTLFVANVSHELRTPLNSIIGFSDLIAAEKLGPIGNEKYRDYACDVRDSGKHLLALVNNLLLFSKIEAGHHRADVVPLSIAREVAQVARLLELEAEKAGVSLVLTRLDDTLAVMADAQGLRQILLNVIGNAIKFSPRDSRVTIRLQADLAARQCNLEIVDHGCGMSEETLAQLGTPFVQADGIFARQHQGSGLGLAICFGLARAMSTKLTIASSSQSGTTVTLSLPLAV